MIFIPHYTSLVKEYSQLSGIPIDTIFLSPKEEYRYFGYRFMSLSRLLPIPTDIPVSAKNESVFIEFRKLLNLEFVIRNAVSKLGSGWAHTIVCGNENYKFILEIASRIDSNIRIILMPVVSVCVDDYSSMLTEPSFWNRFHGENLLVYQEDSFIFNFGHSINDFLKSDTNHNASDFIGAPWNKSTRINANSVGNGGLSLRTKSVIINALTAGKENPNIWNTYNIPSHVLKYMKKQNLQVIPEDVAITAMMEMFNIGKIADYNIAINFSSESIWNSKSFGGHQWWVGNPHWKQRLYQSITNL
jgi:hypothetical protein